MHIQLNSICIFPTCIHKTAAFCTFCIQLFSNIFRRCCIQKKHHFFTFKIHSILEHSNCLAFKESCTFPHSTSTAFFAVCIQKTSHSGVVTGWAAFSNSRIQWRSHSAICAFSTSSIQAHVHSKTTTFMHSCIQVSIPPVLHGPWPVPTGR